MSEEYESWEQQEEREREAEEYNKKADALWQRGYMGQGTKEDARDLSEALTGGDLVKGEHIVSRIEKVKHFVDLEKAYSEGNVTLKEYSEKRAELEGNTNLGL